MEEMLTGITQPASVSSEGTFTMEGGTTMTVADCSAYNEAALASEGYEQMEMTDGTVVYVLNADDRCVIVDFSKDMSVEMAYGQTHDGRRRSIQSIVADGIEFLKKQILEKAKDGLLGYSKDIANYIVQASEAKALFMRNIATCELALMLKPSGFTEEVYLRGRIVKDKLALLASDKVLKFATYLSKVLNKIIPIVNYYKIVSDFTKDFMKYLDLYNAVPVPCLPDYDNAQNCLSMCETGAGLLLAYSTGKIFLQLAGDLSTASSAVAAIPSGGTSILAGLGAYILKQGLIMAADFAFDMQQKERLSRISAAVSRLECEEEEHEPVMPQDPGVMQPRKPSPMQKYEPKTPKKKPLVDPSGFVCEAVESNRLEGVTTTCFFKKEVEDMYGDIHEEITIWDAENYGQQNPQLTNQQGMYGWMVPAGEWQVLYEKEGYETQRSAWLPVPPPQLDVNIGLVRLQQPHLQSGQAYEQAVDVDFSLYMKQTSITSQTLSFWQDGRQLEGTLIATDGETAFGQTAENGPQYGRCYRFVPSEKLALGSKVLVRAHSACCSYAGITLGENQELTLSVGAEVISIGTVSDITVPYGGTHQVVISALSPQAAAFRQVTVSSLSPDIAQLEASSVTLDAEGQAYITVMGMLPGTTYLSFAVEGSQVQGMATVHVSSDLTDVLAAPRASIISGMYVGEGTLVELSAQEDATIWYTLDGSCPCDSEKRQLYTGPIAINDDTTLRAMAVAADGRESEVVTFKWFIASGIRSVNNSKMAGYQGVYDLNGHRWSDDESLDRQPSSTPFSSRRVFIIDGKKVMMP